MKTNKDNKDNTDLLGSLKALLSQVTLTLTEMRLRSQRLVNPKKNTYQITSVLHKKVDELALNSVANDLNSKPSIYKVHQSTSKRSKIVEKYHSSENLKRVRDLGVESEFAKHLSQRKSSSITHSQMGDKLAKSAWEHVHTAIRYAKQGALDKAKINTDIAGHALEEAGHYLSDDEYADLIIKIEQYFKESQ